ncbi:MAG: DUF433 domain-containing protein [Alphaproteobacteria bacterium]
MERIEKKKDVVGGRAKIKDTRIPVWQVILDLQQGNAIKEILYQRPTITAIDIQACEEYYQSNKEEIDFDIKENLEDE